MNKELMDKELIDKELVGKELIDNKPLPAHHLFSSIWSRFFKRAF